MSTSHRSFIWEQRFYDLKQNLWVIPGIFLMVFLLLGFFIPKMETVGAMHSVTIQQLSHWLSPEPATAQLMLSTLAGSLMTVISVVYSLLLVAMSLASTQFSTRVVSTFMRDRFNQTLLGVFIGSFVYCLLIIRAVGNQQLRYGFSFAVAAAMVVVALAVLIGFIHHVVNSIQATTITDRISKETEVVLRDVFGDQKNQHRIQKPEISPSMVYAFTVRATSSGYIQLVDVDALQEIVGSGYGRLHRAMGQFIAQDAVLFSSTTELTPQHKNIVIQAVDIGSVRTMQQDAELGIRQLVDIGLKAISPAVNDPSTGCNCIDHLTQLLLQIANYPDPLVWFKNSKGGGVEVPNTSVLNMLDLAVNQLRQYGSRDVSITLRLMNLLELVYIHTNRDDVKKRCLEQAAHLRQASHEWSQMDQDVLHSRCQWIT